MNPSITEVASYLAAQLPTGADEDEDAVQDWRTTLYNAKATRSLRVVTDLVRRALPSNRLAQEMVFGLERKKRS